MSNDSKNQEIPPGLSLQNDSDQNKQNEKYTEPILETNFDVKRQQWWHCEICNNRFKNRRILKDHQEFFHEMDNDWEEDGNESETDSETDYDFEMFSQNSKKSEEMEENFDFDNQNEDKPSHSKYANLIKNHRCTLCGDVFYLRSKGYYHIKNVHFAKKLELKCTKLKMDTKLFFFRTLNMNK